MRVEVGTIRTISALALLAAAVACTCGMLAQARGADGSAFSSSLTPRLVAGYGLTLLSFAALPKSRRTDLIKLGVLVAILAEILQLVLGRGFSLLDVGAEAVGAFAVLVPSFLERFRSLTRADPHEPFSMVYPNDRRRAARSRRFRPGPGIQESQPPHSLSRRVEGDVVPLAQT